MNMMKITVIPRGKTDRFGFFNLKFISKKRKILYLVQRFAECGNIQRFVVFVSVAQSVY